MTNINAYIGKYKVDPGQDPDLKGQIFWSIERFSIQRVSHGKIHILRYGEVILVCTWFNVNHVTEWPMLWPTEHALYISFGH